MSNPLAPLVLGFNLYSGKNEVGGGLGGWDYLQ